MTSAGATSSPSAAACEARYDDVEDGDDTSDDGLQDRSNTIDNGHEAGANGLEDGFHLLKSRAPLAWL